MELEPETEEGRRSLKHGEPCKYCVSGDKLTGRYAKQCFDPDDGNVGQENLCR